MIATIETWTRREKSLGIIRMRKSTNEEMMQKYRDEVQCFT